jgi:hypothetical protein
MMAYDWNLRYVGGRDERNMVIITDRQKEHVFQLLTK